MSQDSAAGPRLDLWIAVCALLASSLAAGAAVYQGTVIARQLRTTVWPYVTFRESSSNTALELDVENVGAGPAIIGAATLYVDGKPQQSLSKALKTLGFKKENGATVSLTNLEPGNVIRPGDSVQLVRVESRHFAALAAKVQSRTRVEVCYCSMLHECWLKATQSDYPTSIASCERGPINTIKT